MKKLIVFDMAGTIVDHGCQAPISAFVRAFGEMDVVVLPRQARGPMGLHKRDHIKSLFSLEEVSGQWKKAHGREWTDDDVDRIYETFMPMQIDVAKNHTDIIDGVPELFDSLRARGIKVAATTGYPRVVADPIWHELNQQGLVADLVVCSDEVEQGRPAPWLIRRCMDGLGVLDESDVIKVGDTVPDIEAARNAGVKSVAVTLTGNDVGLTQAELQQLDSETRDDLHDQGTRRFVEAGADIVIRSVSELLSVLDD